MSATAPDLNALLGSRICHDLISPLGAISNGVELLSMTGDAMGPEVQLIAESVRNANARIRFFRVAFGIASRDQSIGASEIRDILLGLTENSRLRIDWTVDADTARTEVKLVFLLIQCLENAMPWGGEITVSVHNDRWTVMGSADRMIVRPQLWEALSDQHREEDSTISAAEVQFLLVPELVRDLGRKLSLDISEKAITIRV